MKQLVYDIETDGLDPTRIWCVCTYDLVSGEKQLFLEGDALQFKEYIKETSIFIGHNVISFDNPAIKKIWNITIPKDKVFDTVVIARLLYQSVYSSQSLKDWGKRLKDFKEHYEDWSHYTPEMGEYCAQDVHTTTTLYRYLCAKLKAFKVPKETVRQELNSQDLLQQMTEYGIPCNWEGVYKYKEEWERELITLHEELANSFPPLWVETGYYTAKRKKDGEFTKASANKLAGNCERRYTSCPEKGKDVYLEETLREFNVKSPKMMPLFLKGYWEPYEYSQTGIPKISEANLETVKPDAPPAIFKIQRALMLKSRVDVLKQFIEVRGEDDRVHGRVMSIGSISHRMAHRNPNTANIPGGESPLGKEVRKLLCTPEGYSSVGCDAAGIQLRALAHYVQDESFINAILHADPHVHMAKVYGYLPEDAVYDENIKEHKKARKLSKTTTYAILMGGGARRIGSLAGTNSKGGAKIIDRFYSGLQGMGRVRKYLTMSAKRGYLVALDGSPVKVKSAHYGMSTLLQSFEQAVIKYTMILANKRIAEEGLPAKQYAVVHDEIQYQVKKGYEEQVGQLVAECFEEAGRHYNTKIPLAGDYKYGPSWNESH